MTEDYQAIAGSRESECHERANFFEGSLRLFSITNWITVLVPSLLGVLACLLAQRLLLILGGAGSDGAYLLLRY
jgi:hypothetical protein